MLLIRLAGWEIFCTFAGYELMKTEMSDFVSHHIATLLRRHDCVIVPGVGAFVATREAAALADGVLTPPFRSISFNGALTHDDGLLASSVSRRMKISFEQARERVAAEAALMQRRLKAEGAVRVARVGTLQRMSGGRIEFAPEASWMLTLPAIRAAKPVPAFEVVRPAAPEGREKAVAVVRVPLRLRWLRVAAAAVVLVALGFALSTPIDLEQAQHASLAAPMFTPPEEPEFEIIESPAGLELNLAMPVEQSEPAPAAPEQVAPQAVPAPAASTRPLPYVMVVASLPSRDKAEEFIADQGIPSLQILQSGEKFRVYAGAGSSADEARAASMAIADFSSRFPDAWVCRR